MSLLLLAMLWLVPTSSSGEPRDAYVERLTTIDQAVSSVGTTEAHWKWSLRAMRAAVVVTFARESLFDERVHAGLPHPRWTQDHGRATCLGQPHRSSLLPEWDTLAGSDLEATRRCAVATAKVLSSMAGWCRIWERGMSEDSVARLLAAYGAGVCVEPSAKMLERARAWSHVMAMTASRGTSMSRLIETRR